MKTKILIPVDFSPGTTQAVELATSLARDRDGELVLLHVEEPSLSYTGGGEFYCGLEGPRREQLRALLDKILVTDPEMTVQRHLTVGMPAPAIVEFALKHDVDYIVMPTHGRTGLHRLLMGSVAEEVVRKAPCPVLTVKCNAVKLPRAPIAKEISHV
ncbi:universal stress protein [Anatilimnocola sp. NA78]|uniref:universal stress protein n=1 Tax=Anatilimnocola sp. NA78 TaxID=3415683 RepID=UPI003CE4CF81